MIIVVALVLASMIIVVALILTLVSLLVYPKETRGRGREMKAAEPHRVDRRRKVVRTDPPAMERGLRQALMRFPLALMLISAVALATLATLAALRVAVVAVFQIDLIAYMKVFRIAVLRHVFTVTEIAVVGLCGQGAELSRDATVATAATTATATTTVVSFS